jgi:membrane-associated phospholipid phosphatase
MCFIHSPDFINWREMSLNTLLTGRRGWAVFWGSGLLAILAAFALDGPVNEALYRPAHDGVWTTARALSKYGDWPPILLAGLVTVATLAAVRQTALARLLALILAVGLLTGFAATIIRSTTGRTRPLAAAPQGFYGVRYQGRWIVGKYEFGSFPSGHTAVWAGLAGAAWFRWRRLALVFLAAGVAVAWSRIALGCHHFSDVTAAMVWGVGVAAWGQSLLAPGQSPKSFEVRLPAPPPK